VNGRAAPSFRGSPGPVTLTIAKCVAGGDGLGFVDGKAVFVPGTLPGELVSARPRRRGRDFDAADLVSVLEPSPHRVAPACPYAGRCGGCGWQHIAYEEQLALKRAIVAEALLRTGGIGIEPPPITPSPPWGARNRAQVHVGPDGRLGYMAARSASVAAVDRCPVCAAPIQALLAAGGPAPRGLNRFTVFSDGAFLAVEGRDDARDLSVRVGGRGILFSVGCFFQSNLAALDGLVSWALAELAGETAADLYSGVGLFGAFLADRFQSVTCVEASAMSLSYARRNLPGDRHRFLPAPVEQWAPTDNTAFDAIVADPPRAGLAPELRRRLAARPPRRLVYVSCNPVTLARDLRELVNGGLRLDDVRLFDLYPQTPHVECVARLSPREEAPPASDGGAP
jgi:23S rRNA (uracil1939-C5)-methyltransferase